MKRYGKRKVGDVKLGMRDPSTNLSAVLINQTITLGEKMAI